MMEVSDAALEEGAINKPGYSNGSTHAAYLGDIC